MTHASIEQQIAAAWNAQADEFNQWDELDFEEKIEWAAKWGASQQAAPQPAEPVKKKPYAQGSALGEFGIIPMCDMMRR